MRVEEAWNRRSWRVLDDHGAELGMITISHVGRNARVFHGAWGPVMVRYSMRLRADLGAHVELDDAVSAVVEHHDHPRERSTVMDEAVQKRTRGPRRP